VQPVVLRPRDSLSSASCELQAPPGHLCLTTSREQCPVAPIKRLKYSDFLAGYMNTGRLDMQHSCRFMGLLFKVMVPSVAKGYTFTSKQRKVPLNSDSKVSEVAQNSKPQKCRLVGNLRP